MSAWDAEALRAKLRQRAQSALAYIQKSEAKAAQHPHTRPTAEVAISMSAAEADVCSALADGPLTDRDTLVGELQRLASNVPNDRPGVKNRERYVEQFRRTCEQLLRDHS